MLLLQHVPTLEDSFLNVYRQQRAYTDSYALDFSHGVTLSQYVEAFYSSKVFKIERWLLNCLFNCYANDELAGCLGRGEVSQFSIWTVEMRDDEQLLLCDVFQRTRSWLMCRQSPDPSKGTQLYFGSAVLPKRHSTDGKPVFGCAFHALHGFHHAYSQALLRSTYHKLTTLFECR